jgi:hypothetical protein
MKHLRMKGRILHIFFILSILNVSYGQVQENSAARIVFHGMVMDASSLAPVSNSQILINNIFSSVSNSDGTFSFYVNRKDTVLFKHLGYKTTSFFVSDTLKGLEFVAGVYMQSDTLLIGEVVIIPRFINLKSEIMKAPGHVPSTFDNARYNVAVSAYQGRTTQGKLGDPSSNYEYLHQKQRVDVYEKGQIPSDQIAGFNPLLLLPAAYLLMHGPPEKPAPFGKKLTQDELSQIQKLYLESLNQK